MGIGIYDYEYGCAVYINIYVSVFGIFVGIPSKITKHLR